MVQMLYVDDEHNERLPQEIQRLLTSNGLTCRLTGPSRDLAEIADSDEGIFLIDYDLATAKLDYGPIGYHGNTLATEIRNKKPTSPIVLISRRQITETLDLHLTTERSDFDLILFKNDILDDAKNAQRQILAIYDGFTQLVDLQGQPWSKVVKKLGASEEATRSLREAFPPIDEKRWYVPPTIEWIRCVLMGYPGILYNSLHASARIGLSKDSFLSPSVQKLFASAKYNGPLAAFGDRWWSDRLVGIATQTIIDANVEGPISECFLEAHGKDGPQKLEPSRCLVDKTPGADQICYIFQRPVKRENSIIYYPDSRPSIMDAARVSTCAIKKDDFDETLVEASSIDVVEQIWNQSQ